MGAVELRYNRFVFPIDVMWIKLSDDKGIPIEDDTVSIKAKINQTIVTPKVGYRFIDREKLKIDAVYGLRYWHLENDLNLQPTQPLGSFSDSANWVDAVGGGKIEALLTPKVMVTILGDAGTGNAKLDYQVAGLLGYRLNRKFILQAGYRYMFVNYRPQSTFIYDMAESGVVLGATINLK